LWHLSGMPVFLERFVLPGFVGLIIAVVVANVIQLDWFERIGILVVVVLAAYVVAHFIHRLNQHRPSTDRPPSATAVALPEPLLVPGRTYLTVTPAVLRRFYREHTTMQADELIKPFIGGWIRTRVLLSDMETSGGRLIVSTHESALPVAGDVTLYFGSAWVPRLAHLKRGNWITVDGRIKSATGYHVWLQDCEAIGL